MFSKILSLIDPLESRRLLSSPTSTAQFPVDNGPGAQSDPDVAINAAGQSVMVWDSSSSNFGTPQNILAQRFDASGQSIGGAIPVNQATIPGPGDPSVALNDDGSFVVTWQAAGNDSDILARRFGSQGQPLGDEFPVATIAGGEQLSPDVATNGSGNFTIVWFNGVGGDPGGIDARRFAADGTPSGLQFRVNAPDNTGLFPSITQRGSGEFVVAWMTWNPPLIGIHAQRFDSTGNPVGVDLLIDPRVPTGVNVSPASRAVDVATDAQGDFVVAWFGHDASMAHDAAFVQRFSAAGQPLSAAVRADDTTSPFEVQSVSVATQSDGNFAIAWDEGRGTTRARRFNADGTPATNPFTVATETSRVPAMASDSAGNLLIAWRSGNDRDGTDIYARWRRPEAIPPSVVRTDFEYAKRQQIVIQFSEDVSSSLTPDDIGLINRTTGQTISSGQMTISYDVGNDTATISFPNMIVPDGNYRATIPAADVSDVTGNPLPADLTIDFFVLAGDANHDGVVDVSDLGVLATNWQQSGTAIDFTRGDFNYDNIVDVTDLGILATNWQKTLPA